jgi:hypothetical protein
MLICIDTVRHKRLVARNEKKKWKCRRHEKYRSTVPKALDKNGCLFLPSVATTKLNGFVFS